ncbi:MAG: type II secretion system protein [Verrucomicrobiota bacterium]
MKIFFAQNFPARRRRAFLIADLVVAMSIFAIAMIPLAFSFTRENKLLRAEYHRAAAIEIVDGEMEILAAHHPKNLPDGSSVYKVNGMAATNLPPGEFRLTKTTNHLRLKS